MEMAGGYVLSTESKQNVLYIACATIEETMEMVGVLNLALYIVRVCSLSRLFPYARLYLRGEGISHRNEVTSGITNRASIRLAA